MRARKGARKRDRYRFTIWQFHKTQNFWGRRASGERNAWTPRRGGREVRSREADGEGSMEKKLRRSEWQKKHEKIGRRWKDQAVLLEFKWNSNGTAIRFLYRKANTGNAVRNVVPLLRLSAGQQTRFVRLVMAGFRCRNFWRPCSLSKKGSKFRQKLNRIRSA